ncbi:MAG: hypothetical protein AAFO94_16290, partial [Bacteroidota bacterium]
PFVEPIFLFCMENMIAQFDPIHGFFTPTFMICLMTFVGAIAFVYFNNKREVAYKNRNMRNMFSMLMMFVALFAFGFGGFELFLNGKVTQVSLYEDGLNLPKGPVQFKAVRNIYIYNANKSAVSAGQKVSPGEKVLVVEQYNGRNHFLLEKDYDIQTMITPIRQQFDKWKGEK